MDNKPDTQKTNPPPADMLVSRGSVKPSRKFVTAGWLRAHMAANPANLALSPQAIFLPQDSETTFPVSHGSRRKGREGRKKTFNECGIEG